MSSLFLDTSAFLAVLDADDRWHEPARATWTRELGAETALVTSNYVLVESTALIQHRLGLDALRLFESDVRPVLEVEWLDEEHHERAVAAVLAAGRRKLSLVDCASFDLMRRLGIRRAFTFDSHFEEQGFDVE